MTAEPGPPAPMRVPMPAATQALPRPPAPRGGARRWLALAAGVALVAGMVAFSGPAALADTLAAASLPLLAAAAAAYAAFFAGRGLRWALLLQPVATGATAREGGALSAVGWVVSTFIPFKAGDAVRAAWMARRRRGPLVGVVGTVAVERALDLFGLAATATASLLAIAWTLPAAMPHRLPQAVALAWLLAGLAIAGLAALAAWATRRGSSLGAKALVASAVAAVRPVLRGRSRWAIAALTLACAVLQASVFALLLRALLPGAPWLLLAAAAPIFLLSFIVAVTPGHLGTYEAALVAILALLLGGDPTSFVPVAVATHLLTVTIVTVLGGAGLLLLWWTAPAPTPNAEREATA